MLSIFSDNRLPKSLVQLVQIKMEECVHRSLLPAKVNRVITPECKIGKVRNPDSEPTSLCLFSLILCA